MLKERLTRWVAAVAGAVLLLVVGFAMRPGVSAQGAAPQVSVGQRANLVANILDNVSLTITCAPRSPDTLVTAFVSIEQGVGGRIAHGTINLANNPDFVRGGPLLAACDNAAHIFIAGVLADIGGAAFGDGQAIVTVGVTVCTFQPPFTQTDCATTTVGPRAITQGSN